MKVILSHPTGNANVRAISTALARANMLQGFYTCVALFEKSLLFKLSSIKPLRNFHRRSFDGELKPYTFTRPYKELGRLISQKAGWKRGIAHENGIFCIDKVYQDLDNHVARKIERGKIIYAYEDGALRSFLSAKDKNVTCVYDLPVGYWRAYEKLLEKDIEKYPEWSMTLNFLKNSKEKLERKDRELGLADVIFVASSFTKKTLELYPDKLPSIYVEPYGFPPVFKKRSYEDTKGRKLKFLFVGGLSQRKGLANLFEAIEEFRDEVELTIVGKKVINGCKPLEEGLLKYNWKPSLPHQKILELMRTQDLLIFPSLFEGYGLVIAEAMSQGTPVITTERTCGADFITDNINGWLIPAGDTEALKNKIAEIVEHPEFIAERGREAMKTAEKFPMTLYGDRMAQAITKMK